MSRQVYVPENKSGVFSFAYVKPLLISLSFTLIALCILALCIAFGPVSEQTAEICVLIITVCGTFLAGFLSARPNNSKGYLTGCIAAIGYIFAAYCMSALAFGSFAPGKNFLRLLLTGIPSGAFGGIVGVNTGHKRK